MKFVIYRLTQAFADILALTLALYCAFLLRFEGEVPLEMLKRMVFLAPYVVGTQFALLRLAGVHRFVWRYIGLREVVQIGLVLGAANLSWLIVRLLAGQAMAVVGHAVYFAMPVGIIVIDLILAFGAVVGVRVSRRMTAERSERSEMVDKKRVEIKRTLLVGAGQAGLLVAKELNSRPDLGIKPIGFVDDDRAKVGTTIHGLRVLGTTEDIVAVCHTKRVDEILLTIAKAPSGVIRGIHDTCAQTGLPIRIVPGLYELMDGRVNLTRIREVMIEDLLGRAPIELRDESVEQAVRGQTVLVSGAGGSIGSEICRQLMAFRPSRLVLLEQAENSLFYIHREVTAAEFEAGVEVIPCIADVTDRGRLAQVFTEYQPSLVLHAAAHKHVPMMEWNAGEAIKNNIFGTRNIAEASSAAGVKKFVMVSTDKAVNPTSVMGCTKRVAELVVQNMMNLGTTQFITVRFGNVLGSAGSVIPLFKEQIKNGGPVMVTHPEMTRYFMTIPEACQLVLHAGAMGSGGEIFILDMGEPVKIVDLARDLIRLSGMEPDEDIRIEFSGTRPGEKLYEELSSDAEAAEKTKHPKIFIGQGPGARPEPAADLDARLQSLWAQLDGASGADLRQFLKEIVPEYQMES